MVIPYLPSAQWYASLIASSLDVAAGVSETISYPEVSPRDINRCVVKSNNGQRTLSIPIEGGFSRVKHAPSAPHRVSEHGDWRRLHLAAFMSEYGKMPFFEHLYPQIAEALDTRHSLLSEISTPLHNMAMRMLCDSDTIASLERMRRHDPTMYEKLRRQHSGMVDMHLSVLDALMRLGRETTFALLPPLN
jgi:hypothetical protein